MKKYELFNDLRDPWDWIKIDLYESWYTLWLYRFLTQILSNKDIENIENGKEKQFEATLDYLSDLLRKWKLKVKLNKSLHTRKEVEDVLQSIKDPERIDWYNKFLNNKKNEEPYSIVTTDKEYTLEESVQAINDIKEKWYSFDSEKDRKHFEDFWVMFTLPENEWMM